MAETLTYDAGTDTVTSAENLNDDEQESLGVGDALEAEQEQLLAGKYKNAEELEKAHIELQKKLGEKSEAKSEEPVSEKEPEEPVTEPGNILDELWEQGANNKVDEKTVEKLSKMDPLDIAKMALEARAKSSSPEPRQFTQQDTDQLQSLVGGEENYKNLVGWASQNLSEQEVNMYDKVMALGNPMAAYFAIQTLALKAQDAYGKEGKMVTGKAPSNAKDVFNSQAQVVEAMSDPRYEDDPAYRQSITEKLARSNLSF